MHLKTGQLIVVGIFLSLAGLFSFYLGARFGPEMFWGIKLDHLSFEPLLPEEVTDAELEALLQGENSKTTFHEVLEGKITRSLNQQEVAQEVKEETYMIQVASFPDLDQAKKIYNQLKAEGYLPAIKAVTLADQRKGYHVYVGPYSSIEEGEKEKIRLASSFNLTPLVVRMKTANKY